MSWGMSESCVCWGLSKHWLQLKHESCEGALSGLGGLLGRGPFLSKGLSFLPLPPFVSWSISGSLLAPMRAPVGYRTILFLMPLVAFQANVLEGADRGCAGLPVPVLTDRSSAMAL